MPNTKTTYRVSTNYRNPSTGRFEWVTQAVSEKKAISNVRARVHYLCGAAWCAINTLYWTVEVA